MNKLIFNKSKNNLKPIYNIKFKYKYIEDKSHLNKKKQSPYIYEGKNIRQILKTSMNGNNSFDQISLIINKNNCSFQSIISLFIKLDNVELFIILDHCLVEKLKDVQQFDKINTYIINKIKSDSNIFVKEYNLYLNYYNLFDKKLFELEVQKIISKFTIKNIDKKIINNKLCKCLEKNNFELPEDYKDYIKWINYMYKKLRNKYYYNTSNSSIYFILRIIVLILESCNIFKYNLPIGLKRVKFRKYFNKPVNNLPYIITHIKFGDLFNQCVDYLPYNLKKLKFGCYFNQSVDKLPPNLKKIIFGCNFNQSVDNLPPSLISIGFGKWFDKPIDKLPCNIEELILNSPYYKILYSIPHSIKKLEIYFNNYKVYYKPIDNFPYNIQQIKINKEDLFLIKKIPFGCKIVDLNNNELNINN